MGLTYGDHLPALKTLKAQFCLGEDEYGLLVDCAPNLQCLDTLGCHVFDEGLEALAGLPDLKKLVLCAGMISDHGLEVLVRNCSKLEHLALPYCTGVTRRGYGALAEGCRNLRHLDLSESGIERADVVMIGMACPRLEVVVLLNTDMVIDGLPGRPDFHVQNGFV